MDSQLLVHATSSPNSRLWKAFFRRYKIFWPHSLRLLHRYLLLAPAGRPCQQELQNQQCSPQVHLYQSRCPPGHCPRCNRAQQALHPLDSKQ